MAGYDYNMPQAALLSCPSCAAKDAENERLRKLIHRIASACGNHCGATEAIRVVLQLCKEADNEA